MFHKIKISQNSILIAYKLLHDVLFISLVFLGLSLLAEGILPGIISSHVGLSKIVLLAAFCLVSIKILQDKTGLKPAGHKGKKNKALYALIVFGFVLIINSMLKIGLFLNLFIAILLLIAGYLIFAILDQETN